jgi:ribosomal protein S18 acetylase RimI-like enzyme
MHPVPPIQKIEAAAYKAWPAAERVDYDGWQLRYAHGFSRRGNSVYPAQPSTIDLGLKLEWCAAWYEQRGLGLVVRQNPATEPGLDEDLDSRGFGREGVTNVMVAAITVGDQAVAVEDTASAAWSVAARELWGIGPDQIAGWRGIIERIDVPAGFALVKEGDRPVAAALAVAVGRWLGLFEIVVAPERRRQGIGSRLTSSLMTWGAALGADSAFLQVVAENGPAINMYEGLGFEFCYRYWYRRAPSA